MTPSSRSRTRIERPRSVSVARARVQHALDQGRQTALTLVAAPAGYGKTTAVRVWCSKLDHPFAWVTLDAGDNDPAVLWRYIATAVGRARPSLGLAALERLDVASGSIDAAGDDLMNRASALGGELVVVLDSLLAVRGRELMLDGLATSNGLESCGRNDVPGRQRFARASTHWASKVLHGGIGRQALRCCPDRLVRT
jgi:LuxR family maltose regulon positive regulatory protein